MIARERIHLETGEKINENLLCSICNEILINPKNCNSCLSLFCQACIDHIISISGVCTCKADKINIINAHKVILKMLSKIKVCCSNRINGCQEISYYETYIEHEKVCKYKKFQCRNQGCLEEFVEEIMPEHLKICGYNLAICRFCKQELYSKDKNSHEINCNQSIQSCSGCKAEMIKKDLDEHFPTCDKVELQCKSCRKTLLRKDFINHSQVECLRKNILEFKCSSHQTISVLRDKVRVLLDKLKIQEKYMKQICNVCKMFSCDSQLESCYQCKTCYCQNCYKGKLKNCSECKSLVCIFCLDFLPEKNKCFNCEDKSKKSTSTYFKVKKTEYIKNFKPNTMVSHK